MDSIVHFTSESALISILKSKYLYDQIDRKTRGIALSGEGVNNRVTLSAYDENVELSNMYEATGVYFRLWLDDLQPFPPHSQSLIGIELSIDVLQTVVWHLNTCENNGFVIRDGKAPWGDCENEIQTLHDLRDVNLADYHRYGHGYELVIEKSVDIQDFLIAVHFNDEKTYGMMKGLINDLGYDAVLH